MRILEAKTIQQKGIRLKFQRQMFFQEGCRFFKPIKKEYYIAFLN
jgi:hypothetical protein